MNCTGWNGFRGRSRASCERFSLARSELFHQDSRERTLSDSVGKRVGRGLDGPRGRAGPLDLVADLEVFPVVDGLAHGEELLHGGPCHAEAAATAITTEDLG